MAATQRPGRRDRAFLAYVLGDMEGRVAPDGTLPRFQPLPYNIDMIKAGAHTDIVYAYNYALGGAGMICRSLIASKSTDFASTWEKVAPVAEKGLEDLIRAFDGAEK